MNRSIRLRNAREAGLVLPQSGYEMFNEEMMYVDGGWHWVAAIGLGVAGVGLAVATGGASLLLLGKVGVKTAGKIVAVGGATFGVGGYIASASGRVTVTATGGGGGVVSSNLSRQQPYCRW